MQKIRKALFEENRISNWIFTVGMMTIIFTIWFLQKQFILAPFFWKGRLYDGIYLHFTYATIAFFYLWFTDYCKNKSIIRMLTSGLTPIAFVACLRWCFSGFFAAIILIIIIITYSVFIIAQMVGIILKGRKNKVKIIGKGINKILYYLSVFAIIGCSCYYLTEKVTADEKVVDDENVISEADENLLESNSDVLRLWKKDIYSQLSEEEKKELYQKLINLECHYWGIEPIKLVVETYDSETINGYYNNSEYIISISKERFKASRSSVMRTLLHETHHAWINKVVESIDWEDEKIEENKQLRLYKVLYVYKEGIENYIPSEIDYDMYYNNPIEISARKYAEDRTEKYLEYIDGI